MKPNKEFEIIECGGTLYEIGKQYGEACRESILKSLDMNLGALEQTYHADREQIFTNAKKFLPYVERFYPEVIEMLRGQSEGSAVSFDEIFALRCNMELASQSPAY